MNIKRFPFLLAFFSFLLLIALVGAASIPDSAASAQVSEPTPVPSGAGSTEASFPWLAVLLFVVMAGLLTWFRSHPSYPKKATGNCCAPVVDGDERPFRIIEDEIKVDKPRLGS